MWETRVWSLGLEDPLEKEMATHVSIRAWEIPWTEDPGQIQSMGLQRVQHTWVTETHKETYTMGYHLAMSKKDILPLATTWMNREDIMPSEISQTEKDKYCMLSHSESRKVELMEAWNRMVVTKTQRRREKGKHWSQSTNFQLEDE